MLGPGWSLQNPSSNTCALRADFAGDPLSWKTNLLLDSSWAFDADVWFNRSTLTATRRAQHRLAFP